MGIAKVTIDKTTTGIGGLIKLYSPRNIWEKGILWALGVGLITYAVICLILSFYWDMKPDTFDVRANAVEMAGSDETKLVPGYVTTATVIRVAETLLNKPGGYLSNDVMPPGVLMDNMPNWEFGVLVQLRDMARAMRNDFSRAQTQSIDDRDLQIADPQFNFDSESWIFPSTESEYRKGLKAMYRYMIRLTDENPQDGQFFARADNLRDYVGTVAKRLGNYAQRLGASVGHTEFGAFIPGTSQPQQSPSIATTQRAVRTPWMEIDNVFYEARGGAWALLHFLKAIEQDLSNVVQDKNAEASLRQVIRELENSQETMWSPAVLNGTGFGIVANHSLVLASYIARANTALVDLRDLLRQG